MAIIKPYKGVSPNIHDSVFVADNAAVLGDVEIGANSNIWFSVTLRGDVHSIRVGARTNIQDGSVVHVTTGGKGTHIGDDVTIGHGAILHDCNVHDFGFVGMQACVMDGAIVESFGMLGAGALLTPGKVVPAGQLWAGRPAKYMRDITAEEREYIQWSATHYVRLGRDYKDQNKK